MIVSGSDGVLVGWDLKTRKPLFSLSDNCGWIYSLVRLDLDFSKSPYGRRGFGVGSRGALSGGSEEHDSGDRDTGETWIAGGCENHVVKIWRLAKPLGSPSSELGVEVVESPGDDADGLLTGGEGSRDGSGDRGEDADFVEEEGEVPIPIDDGLGGDDDDDDMVLRRIRRERALVSSSATTPTPTSTLLPSGNSPVASVSASVRPRPSPPPGPPPPWVQRQHRQQQLQLQDDEDHAGGAGGRERERSTLPVLVPLFDSSSSTTPVAFAAASALSGSSSNSSSAHTSAHNTSTSIRRNPSTPQLTCIATLEGHDDRILAVIAIGDVVLSASEDSTLRLWTPCVGPLPYLDPERERERERESEGVAVAVPVGVETKSKNRSKIKGKNKSGFDEVFVKGGGITKRKNKKKQKQKLKPKVKRKLKPKQKVNQKKTSVSLGRKKEEGGEAGDESDDAVVEIGSDVLDDDDMDDDDDRDDDVVDDDEGGEEIEVIEEVEVEEEESLYQVRVPHALVATDCCAKVLRFGSGLSCLLRLGSTTVLVGCVTGTIACIDLKTILEEATSPSSRRAREVASRAEKKREQSASSLDDDEKKKGQSKLKKGRKQSQLPKLEERACPIWSIQSAHSGVVWSLQTVDDEGRHFASAGGDKKVRLWSVKSRQCLREFTVSNSVFSILRVRNFTVAVAGGNMEIEVWSMLPDRPPSNLAAVNIKLEGHNGDIEKLIALDSDRIASASADGSVRVWNWAEAECICSLEGHRGSVESLVYLECDEKDKLIGDRVSFLVESPTFFDAQASFRGNKIRLFRSLLPDSLVRRRDEMGDWTFDVEMKAGEDVIVPALFGKLRVTSVEQYIDLFVFFHALGMKDHVFSLLSCHMRDLQLKNVVILMTLALTRLERVEKPRSLLDSLDCADDVSSFINDVDDDDEGEVTEIQSVFTLFLFNRLKGDYEHTITSSRSYFRLFESLNLLSRLKQHKIMELHEHQDLWLCEIAKRWAPSSGATGTISLRELFQARVGQLYRQRRQSGNVLLYPEGEGESESESESEGVEAELETATAISERSRLKTRSRRFVAAHLEILIAKSRCFHALSKFPGQESTLLKHSRSIAVEDLDMASLQLLVQYFYMNHLQLDIDVAGGRRRRGGGGRHKRSADFGVLLKLLRHGTMYFEHDLVRDVFSAIEVLVAERRRRGLFEVDLVRHGHLINDLDGNVRGCLFQSWSDGPDGIKPTVVKNLIAESVRHLAKDRQIEQLRAVNAVLRRKLKRKKQKKETGPSKGV